MNEKLFFQWLYYLSNSILIQENKIALNIDSKIIDLQDLINFSETSMIIDKYIFLRKILADFKSKQFDFEKTLQILSDLPFFTHNSKYLWDDIWEKPRIVDSEYLDFLSLLSDFSKVSDHTSHDNYPTIDPIKGRPHMGWLKCYHYECKYTSDNSDNLRKHLLKFDSYIPYFHKMHENIVKTMQLTPEKIFKEKIKICPSPICDERYEMTPSQLVRHFSRLGIEPFWHQNYVFDYQHEINRSLSGKNIHRSENCLICLNKQPEILFLPCYHHCVCFSCFFTMIKNGKSENYTNSKCFLCNRSLSRIIPY